MNLRRLAATTCVAAVFAVLLSLAVSITVMSQTRVVSGVVSEKIYVQGAVCTDGSGWSNWDLPAGLGMANGGPGYGTCITTSNGPLGQLAYDNSPATPEDAYNAFRLPSDWTGAINLAILWQTPATSGNVKWFVYTACVAANTSLDPSWNAAQTVTTAAPGTGGRLQVSAIASVTTTGCAAGSLFKYRIKRDADDAADTIADYVGLVAVEWTYRRAL